MDGSTSNNTNAVFHSNAKDEDDEPEVMPLLNNAGDDSELDRIMQQQQQQQQQQQHPHPFGGYGSVAGYDPNGPPPPPHMMDGAYAGGPPQMVYGFPPPHGQAQPPPYGYPPPPYGYPPYPPAQYYPPGYHPPPPHHQHQQQHPPPPPPPPPQQQQQGGARPPRSRRTGNNKQSPIPSLLKDYSVDTEETNEELRAIVGSPTGSSTGGGGGGGSLPPLKDIFSNTGSSFQHAPASDEQPLLRSSSPNLNSGSGGGGGGYGSTTSRFPPIPTGKSSPSPLQNNAGGASSQQAPPPPPSKDIFHNNNNSGSKIRPVLVRTTSSGGIKEKVSAQPVPASPKSTKRTHRRSSSDTPLRIHRRVHSDQLPPVVRKTNSPAGSLLTRKRFDSKENSGDDAGSVPGYARRRSFSAASAGKSRGDVISSAATYSSNVSVVSNIAKSKMFGGVTDSGHVQLHFPYESVRLQIMNPHDTIYQNKDKTEKLEIGKFYQETQTSDPEKFETYHAISASLEGGLAPQWESLDVDDHFHGLANGRIGEQQLLPAPSYVLTVPDDVYCRVLSEIADADQMPCGLFFCGHHEDVSHPSIGIAMVAVAILFITMGLIAFYTG